jgi:hypothetical protein
MGNTVEEGTLPRELKAYPEIDGSRVEISD